VSIATSNVADTVSGRASTNGVEIAYRLWRARQEAVYAPTVLLHGVLQTGDGMRHLAEQLSMLGDVLAPDLRGRGGSSQPASGYEPEVMATDVAGLIRELGWTRSVVIGRLHGAIVAYHLAARFPELVQALVIGNAAPEVNTSQAQHVLAAVTNLPRDFASLADAESFYERELGLSAARIHSDLLLDLEPRSNGRMVWKHNLDAVRSIEAAANPRDDWGLLTNIACPTLILRGQRGGIRRETFARMGATVPNSRTMSIMGAGHDVFLGPGAEQTMAAIQLFMRGSGRLSR
jgi:pimeloyl-ACP methyl ester carboxylesterase